MGTQNKHTATSTSQFDGIWEKDSQSSTSSYYYLLFWAICQWFKKKDELTVEQKKQFFCTWKEYLGICFLNALVFPLRTIIKQHEIYYNTGNYINSLKSFGKAYGRIASPEEAFDILSSQNNIVRNGILVMANNFLSLKQAIDDSLKEQFVCLCNEAQQGMSDILLVCGFLRDESLVQIHRNDIISVTDENGKELGDKGLAEIIQELCSRRKTIMNMKGELPFLHHYSGKKGEERYPIHKAIVLYKLTLKNYFATLNTYSGSEIVEIDDLHIKGRNLFYKITVPVYLSTMKEAGLDIDAFIQRWEDTYGNDSVWVAEAKRFSIKSNNPIIEKPSTVNKHNGKAQCWLKEDTRETEVSIASKIDKWCKFLKQKLDSLQGYDKKANNRIKQITMISCSIIYGVMEDIGYANDYLSGRYGKSFDKTMKETTFGNDFRRQDFKVYMKMIHAFKNIMGFIKEDTIFSRHGSLGAIKNEEVFGKPNYEEIKAEMRMEILSIHSKNEFFGNFLSSNFYEFLDIYKQLLQRIKKAFKIKLETPQYNTKRQIDSSPDSSIESNYAQNDNAVEEDVLNMFNDYETAELN